MSDELRKSIDIVDQWSRTERTLSQITSLRIGFEAEGALIATGTREARRPVYVVSANALVSDDVFKSIAALKDDELKIAKLIQLGVLRNISV